MQTRAVFDLVIRHLNAALAAATVEGVLRKREFDAVKKRHRLQCLKAIKLYIIQDIKRGTSKYSHNTHTLMNARKLLAEYQQNQLPWLSELHHCGQDRNLVQKTSDAKLDPLDAHKFIHNVAQQPGAFLEYTLDAQGCLEAVVWVLPEQVEAMQLYGDVWIQDNTAKTLAANLPFFAVVGVDGNSRCN